MNFENDLAKRSGAARGIAQVMFDNFEELVQLFPYQDSPELKVLLASRDRMVELFEEECGGRI